MIRRLSSFVALVIVLVAGIAPAAPFTSSFDALRADLQTRHDNDYSGVLGRTQRKELAAIDGCLANVDAPHASISDDAKTLRFVTTKLVRAFGGQFSSETPGTLPGLLAGAAAGLLAEAEAAYGSLQSAIDAAVDPARRERASDLAAKARAWLDEAALPDTPPATAAALLRRAANAIAKALPLANYRPPLGVRCRIGTRNFVASAVDATIGDAPDTTLFVSITASAEHPVTGATETIQFNLSAELGVPVQVGAVAFPFRNFCTYDPDGVPESLFYSQYSDVGVATIDSFDRATGSASGRFSAFLMRNGHDRLTITRGTFRVAGATVLPGGE